MIIAQRLQQVFGLKQEEELIYNATEYIDEESATSVPRN